MSHGGKKHTATTTNTLDPATAAEQAAKYKASQAYANSGPINADPATMAALAGDKQYAAYGQQGLLAMQGDPTAMAQFQTPGGADILKQMDVNAADASRSAVNSTNQSATRSGAFGGDRAALAQGTAVAGVNAANANQKAQFQYQQNSDAFNRANAAMGIGMNANNAQAQMGQYLRSVTQENDPAYKALQAYSMGLNGTPYTTSSSSTTTTPWGSVIAGGLLGGLGAYKGSQG